MSRPKTMPSIRLALCWTLRFRRFAGLDTGSRVLLKCACVTAASWPGIVDQRNLLKRRQSTLESLPSTRSTQGPATCSAPNEFDCAAFLEFAALFVLLSRP